MKRTSEGFSLIEVIIAMAVLAILSLPLLAYFDYASRSTSEGKFAQKAGMVAQSVVEELNASPSFEDIETKLILATGSAWTVESITADETNMVKNVTLEDIEYQAKVNIDYTYSNTDASGNTIGAKYNNYAAPQLTEVYSEKSAVFAESDQLSTAISNFYYKDTSIPQSSIEAGITRKLVLNVEKVTEANEVYVMNAAYDYSYNGESYHAVIEHSKVEVSKLENIYIFYNLLSKDIEDIVSKKIVSEDIEVNFTNIDIEEAKKLNIYFVCQKGGFEIPDGYYSLSINGVGNYMQATYFTNGISSSTLSMEKDIVAHKTEKRIALVTVDIYYKDETVFNEETRLARIQTSKGE